MQVARECAGGARSKAGLDRCRHTAEKTPGQALVVPQDEGNAHEFPGDVHDRDITIRASACNESWNA
jgi:hypothetical protein